MKKTPAVIGLIVASWGLAGCGQHTSPPQTMPSPPVTAPPVVNDALPTRGTAPAKPGKALVYVVDDAHGKDSDNYLVAKPIPLRDAQDPAREALQALLTAPDTPIPAGTTLNSVKVADGLATVDFSRSPVDETHGEETQTQALEALQRTLGQFPEIERIQIEVNGEAPASIGEAAGGPIDVIRPGGSVREAGGA